MNKPETCASCGSWTQSHNVAIDVSEHDDVGLPTLAGVVCHSCWTGNGDGPAVGDLMGDPDALMEALDTGEMVSVGAPVEDLTE
jgi:hypothetical protein